MDDKRFTTGQIAEHCDITRRTLHFYEEIGLIKPCEKGPAGQRLYDANQVKQIQYVTHLKNLGLSLKDIKNLLQVRKKHKTLTTEAASELTAFIDDALPRIQKQIAELADLQNDLVISREMLRSCSRCGKQAGVSECSVCDHVTNRDEVPQTFNTLWLPAR